MAEGSVITEKGRALLGKILATNSTLNITGAQIGSGDLPAGTPPASMTALASYVMAKAIGCGVRAARDAFGLPCAQTLGTV